MISVQIFLFLCVVYDVYPVFASVGDRSEIYLNCLYQCLDLNCSSTEKFAEKQQLIKKLFQWDCPAECRYDCMWSTVDWFKKTKNTIPQFYGKWPFFRLFGIQEPASTLFSILNGVAHYSHWKKFRKRIPNEHPMYYVYFTYGVVCINAWIWSTVFHTRDLHFTEIMDYISALLAVITSTFVLLVRVFDQNRGYKSALIAFFCFAFYLRHVNYLCFVKFDYGYNMTVALFFGLVNLFGSLLWYFLRKYQQPHVWKCAATAVLVNVLLLLEIVDFSAFFIFDTHSLWHLSTIPLHRLWYSFAIDDCLYLIQMKKVKRE
uniref:Post-GPI attachment to proteins factor 3 n=1 Tax=Strigamia maritima TaxID=126957 RepID=T1JAC6_STRMM